MVGVLRAMVEDRYGYRALALGVPSCRLGNETPVAQKENK